MAPGDANHWNLPTWVRPLTWLPVVAFVLAVSAPDLLVPAIAVAGVVLALAGAVFSVVAGRLTAVGAGRAVAPNVHDGSPGHRAEFS